jgi:hypothetical protein
MTKTLIESIENWLGEGGYPLELYVAKKLTELSFFCWKSPFFTDTESDKPRACYELSDMVTSADEPKTISERC